LPARGRHQRGLAFRKRGVGIGTGREQHLDDRRVAGGAGEREWGDAVAVGSFDLCASANQQLGRLRVVGADRPVQRRRPVGLGRVDVNALPDERLHGRAIAGLNRVDESNRSGADAAGADRQQRPDDDDNGKSPRHHRISSMRPLLSPNAS